MRRKKNHNSKARNKHLVALMAFSLGLLVLLQLAWLRAEYRSAMGSFRRETNMVFRNTIMQIADSLFMTHLATSAKPDSLIRSHRGYGVNIEAKERRPIQFDIHSSNAIDTIIKNYEIQRIQISGGDSGRKSIRQRVNPYDTIAPNPRRGISSRHFRFFSGITGQPINPDSLAAAYRNALHYRMQTLPFEIIQKEVNWMAVDWERVSRQRNDSLPFATGFYPLGPTSLYAANFENVRGFLLLGIMPQAGFSIFTTGLIIILFVLMMRNIKAQQKLIEQKNDFIGNMTHELKTPVATVGVALEAMKHFDVLKNKEKAEQYIDMALHELDRLSLMTDKILKTSIFDYREEIEKNREPVDLSLIAQKVFNSFTPIAEKNQVNFTFHCNGQYWIMGHAEHLSQLIYNLVDNAFKYGGNNAEVGLSIRQVNNQVELLVSDTGVGIAPEHHQKIFEKFYRVPSGNVHTVKGYGLGLCYVDGVAKSHGGKVSLQSQQGQGAVFIVTLPLNPSHGKD